jgi:signal transduction histidine kinase/CheY-like chemotaxis protein
MERVTFTGGRIKVFSSYFQALKQQSFRGIELEATHERSPHPFERLNLFALLLAAGLCVLIICVAVVLQSMHRVRSNSDLVAETREQMRAIDKLELSIKGAQNDDSGNRSMEEISQRLTSIRSSYNRSLEEYAKASDQAYSIALLTALISTTVGLSLVAAAFLTMHYRRKKKETATTVDYSEYERLPVTFASIGDGEMCDLASAEQSRNAHAELATLLNEAERRRNEFLAALAHELRNPLAPIKNAVQLMGMLKLDPEVDELRQMMARQVEELVRLIDDLLDVSQISRGQISLRREVVDLLAIIAAAVSASSRSIAENGQKLIVTVPDGNKVCVYGDPLRLTQVISNLLNNSAKYSLPDSGIELAVVVSNDVAEISFRDHGIGIAPEVLPNIFDMFSRADNRPERGSTGLGISLKLVKAIVDLHDGTVVAQSDGVGKGSTFTVRLPMVHDLTSSKTIPAIMPQAVSARSFKVLVVEDMRALRLITSRLLEKLGHEVEVVENGPLALIKLETFTPDVVFSDIAMPGMSGYELAQQLRQRPDCSRVCLVALTGLGQPSDRDKALEAGFHEHMLKPVDIAVLQSLFEKLSRSVAA